MLQGTAEFQFGVVLLKYDSAVSVLVRNGKNEIWDERGRKEHKKCMTLFLQKM